MPAGPAMGPPLQTGMTSQRTVGGCRVGGGTPCEGPAHLPITRLAKAIRRWSGPVSRCQSSPGARGPCRHLQPPSTLCSRGSGWGGFPSQPRPPGPAPREFPSAWPSRAVITHAGGDPVAQRGRPTGRLSAHSRLDASGGQIAPSSGKAGAAAVRPSVTSQMQPRLS